MRSKATARALQDIVYNIDLAGAFCAPHDLASFKHNIGVLYATTRCLEIISEASRRLPVELKQRHPDIAWKNMAGAGNIYRHEYESVSPTLVWDTVHIALPPLRAVASAELLHLDSRA